MSRRVRKSKKPTARKGKSTAKVRCIWCDKLGAVETVSLVDRDGGINVSGQVHAKCAVEARDWIAFRLQAA